MRGRLPRSRLLAGVWAGALPLGVWAAHFFISYAAVAVACDARWGGATGWLGHTLLQWSLLAGWGLALAVLAVLLRRAWGGVRTEDTRLLPGVRLGAAVLAGVGTLWTGMPLLWLMPCRWA
ncbi:hypothetical protein OOT46_12230 [Aquabacterium sp. A7-Y]|uniref:hypothetical protein n=1 Tax=Aquabacterium sp. A7-Y TaxID=1349605 RepID=UPI00223DFEE7|nr:hypothetical protein [Aquabacterium sp. A7-Y]MCW7538610.1 hypothetical protein [Aquabacterium sp. A7-Y]